MYPQRYDEVFVISDLHFGGDARQSMFRNATRLCRFVDHLRTNLRDTARIALVLNGDTFDFFIDPGAKYFDPSGAVRKLRAIVDRVHDDPDLSIASVWDALRAFVSTKNRELVFVLGNHDVELALPTVQSEIARDLCEDDAARGRLHFATDGLGFACDVHGANVLCVHGHEADDWNRVVPGELLEQLAAVRNGHHPPPWIPNPGAQLVVDVLNDEAPQFPFLRVLLPPGNHFVEFMKHQHRGVLSTIWRSRGPLARRLAISLRRKSAYLGDGHEAESTFVDDDATQTTAALLESVEQMYQAGVRPETCVIDPHAMLHSTDDSAAPALEALAAYSDGDRDRALDGSDPTFEHLGQRLAPNVHFRIAGHTHFARTRAYKAGPAYYFNSGTWVTTMHVPDHIAAKSRARRELFDRFADNPTLETMPALHTDFTPTAVHIYPEDNEVVGHLCVVDEAGCPITHHECRNQRYFVDKRDPSGPEEDC